MLLNTENDSKNPNGFRPNVQNQAVYSSDTISKGAVAGYWTLFVLAWLCALIPGIVALVIRIKTRNRINAAQMDINNAASNIDVQLAKRADLLVQLQNEAVAYLRHEGITFKNVAQLRSGNSLQGTAQEKQEVVNDMARNVDIAFENYPNLRGVEVIGNLMSQSSLLAMEIAAAQRVYNNRATQFNSEIVTWPTNVIIKSLGVHSFPLFEASEQQKQTPTMSGITNIEY